MAKKLLELSISCAQPSPFSWAEFQKWVRAGQSQGLSDAAHPIWRHSPNTCWWQPEFCSCRGKTARVINYEEFKKALEELAPKRFKDKSKEEAYEAICQLVAGKEPINVGVTVSEELLGCGSGQQEGRMGLCPLCRCFPGDPMAPGEQDLRVS